MCAVFVSLLVLLVHHELKVGVLELSVKHESQKVGRAFVGVSVLALCKEGVHAEVLDSALEILQFHLVGQLVKRKATFVLVLELLVILVFLDSLLFGCLLLLAGHIVLRAL